MSIVDLVFPKKCLNCQTSGVYICQNCLDKLQPLVDRCPVCGGFTPDGATHSTCRKPYSLDGLISIWPYQGVIRRALINLKYQFATDIAAELTIPLTVRLKQKPIFQKIKFTLIPIPIHPLRKNWRGFNQSEVIGRGITRNLGWKFNPQILNRSKITSPQTGLKGQQRKQNIRGVFSLTTSGSLSFYDSPLIIFDDVWTTGSTIKEAAKVLKRNGVNNVWGLTVARTT